MRRVLLIDGPHDGLVLGLLHGNRVTVTGTHYQIYSAAQGNLLWFIGLPHGVQPTSDHWQRAFRTVAPYKEREE